MCRLLAWSASEPQAAAELLEPDELRSLTRLSEFHRDGWGLSTAGGEQVRRSIQPACADSAFTEATTQLRSHAGLLHLRRATPGYAVMPENTHPFVLDGWAFAHNGTIAGAEMLDGLLETRWRERRRGTTDSERYFLLFLQALEKAGSPIAALRETVEAVRDTCGDNGLNAVACSADHLLAAHAAQGQNPDRPFLVALMGEGVADPHVGIPTDHLEDYFGLRYRLTATSVVISSTGIAGSGWESQPEDSVVSVDRARGVIECRALSGDALWNHSAPVR